MKVINRCRNETSNPHFNEAFAYIYVIMTKISPKVSAGSNKHVDTNA